MQNEKHSTSSLLLQRQKPMNAATAQKGEKQNGCHRPSTLSGALQHSVGKKPASNSRTRNKSKKCSWGLVKKKKKNCEYGSDFRLKNILLKGNSNLSEVECDLCKKQYDSNLMYINCENCTKWYHADAVELEESTLPEVIGFKCCKCRKIRSPCCPYADPKKVSALECKKANKRAPKQASQVTGSCREPISEPVSNVDESASTDVPVSSTKSQSRAKKAKNDDEQTSKLDDSVGILAGVLKKKVDSEKLPIPVEELWDIINAMELGEELATDAFVFLLKSPVQVEGLMKTPIGLWKLVLSKMMKDAK